MRRVEMSGRIASAAKQSAGRPQVPQEWVASAFARNDASYIFISA